MQKRSSLTKTIAEIKLSFRLGAPLLISELMYAFGGFISTLMVAHLGKEELAANVLVFPIFWTLILFFIGILLSVTVLVAQSHGAHDKKGVQIATQQGILVALISSLPMMITMMLAPKILLLTGQNPTIINLAKPFFYSLSWCMLPFVLFVTLEQFLLGITKTRAVMLISTLLIPLQIGSIYFFIHSKYHLGLASVGFGFSFSYVVLSIILGTYIHFSKTCRDYHIFSGFWRFNKKFFTQIILLGVPIGSMLFIELSLFATNALLIGKFGPDALAGHQIAAQCVTFTLNIIFAIGQTVSIRVGYEVGQNNREALKRAFSINLLIGFVVMLFIGTIYMVYPSTIIALDFNIHAAKVQSAIRYAMSFMGIAALIQFADCGRIVGAHALRSLKDTKFPMLMSIIGFWVIGFPTSYFLAFTLHLGAIGVWFGTLIGLSLCALILLLRFTHLSNTLDLQQLITKS